MKRVLTFILMTNCLLSLSQTKNDVSEIIELIVLRYQSDTSIVYHRFNNEQLLSEIENTYLSSNELLSDKDSISIKNVKVGFSNAVSLLKRKSGKRISNYSNLNLNLKKSKDIPKVYISFPVIAADGKKALVYENYICGSLCGELRYFVLEKTNDKWTILFFEVMLTY